MKTEPHPAITVEQIKFSTNLNHKLDCPCFTSIRLYNPKKYREGVTFQIIRQDNPNLIRKAELLEIRSFKLEHLTDLVAYLDTGYSRIETQEIIRKMYPRRDWNHQFLMLLLFRYLPEPKPIQGALFPAGTAQKRQPNQWP